MSNFRPIRLIGHSFTWLARLTLLTSAVMAVLCALIIVILRYWLLPDIEQFHGKITTSLSNAMENPVSIGQLKGDWDGLQPHLSMFDVRILNDQGMAALVLPRIEVSVSWLSLLAAELRFASLEIERPELLIRRNAFGIINIGSVSVKSNTTNTTLSDWMLHQPRIVVRDALIVWQDEQRGAPPLTLKHVNLRIESRFNHHRFALRAVPPASLSSTLDVRGDFHGRHFNDLNKWSGQLYTQLNYIDLLPWQPWLNLPPQLSSGRGGLRSWLSIKNGQLTQLTTDLALRDVVTRLGNKVPEMKVNYLRGRVAWQIAGADWEVYTQNFTMRLLNGLAFNPVDFTLRITPGNDKQPSGGQLQANQLQLESLVSLANFLPLEAGLRSKLTAYAPRGHVNDLDMSWQSSPQAAYSVKGKFNNLALQQVGKLPGFSGLSVTIDGNQDNGIVHLNAHHLKLDAPGYMREGLSFDTLTGQVRWGHKNGEMNIQLTNIALVNEDLAGVLFGSYQSKTGTKGILDLTVNLTRGQIKHAARYTPLIALDKKDNDWLNGALLSGHTEDFHLRLNGLLDDFPLNGTTKTSFEITAHAQNASMEYAPDWPIIDNISGEFSIKNNRMEVIAPSATILGAQISHLSILQPDMAKFDTPLQITGEADAKNNTFLQFIQKSPVRGYINGFTDGVSASGYGHLNLSAQIPLMMSKPVRISGRLSIPSSDIDFGAGVPWLRNTLGVLTFTESGMKVNNATADILGGATHLNVETAEAGAVRVNLQGHSSIEALRKTENAPLLNYLQGGTDWDAHIIVVNKIAEFKLNANLAGLTSTLPPPFNKTAQEIMPLHIEKKNIADHQDMISAQLGNLFNAYLISTEAKGINTIQRGVINFGAQNGSSASEDTAAGIWLEGTIPVLALQGWDNLTSGTSSGINISGANLHIGKLTGYGMSIEDMHLLATKNTDGIVAQLSGNSLNGKIVFEDIHGRNKVTAHLRNLAVDESVKSPVITIKPAKPLPKNLPVVDINIEDFVYKGKKIGHLELTGLPENDDWRLSHIAINNPDGNLTGTGLWHGNSTRMQTEVGLLLDISNAGNILSRSGYPDTVKNGSGKLKVNLRWDGQPDDFNYASLNGTLKLDTDRGRFLKMDPGFGKLLGILSLQALPRHITLDFTDVFSAGFEFNNINGNATILHGVIQTDDLHMDGSSAKVTMKGQINLNDETQNMRVEVLPTLGASVSMLSAFAAGPAVGIGALIVNRILGNPLDKLVSFEYNISGSWRDPKVVKIGEKPIELLQPNTEDKHTEK
jgi:uncharacterized protein (TIGR02099 family)